MCWIMPCSASIRICGSRQTRGSPAYTDARKRKPTTRPPAGVRNEPVSSSVDRVVPELIRAGLDRD